MSEISKTEGKRKALIISISNYDNLPELDFCKNDGNKIYDILKSQNYEIMEEHKLIGKVSYDEIRNAIIDFFRSDDVKRKDTLFFYFSGHGFLDSVGDPYLSTSKFDPNQPDIEGYRFEDLTRMVDKSISSKIIVALDCCHSGAAGLGGKGDNEAGKLGREAILSTVERKTKWGEGRCILASSLGLQESFKMPDKEYSAFTYFLAKGLEGGDDGESVNENGFVTPELLGRYVDDKLLGLEKPLQRPIRKMELTGEIILAHHPDKIRPKLVPTPIPTILPWYKSKLVIVSISVAIGIIVSGVILFPSILGGPTGYAEEYSFVDEIKLDEDPSLGDLAVDSFGNIYAVDSPNSRILKFNSSGKFLRDFRIEDGYRGYEVVYEIDTDSLGNVYMLDDRGDVRKLDSKGNLEEWKAESLDEYDSARTIKDIAVDTSGDVYVAISNYSDDRTKLSHYIHKFNNNGKLLEWEIKDLDAEHNAIDNVDVDSSGNVYVVHQTFDMVMVWSGNDRILKVNSDGEFLDEWRLRDENGQIDDINSIEIDSVGNVYAQYTVWEYGKKSDDVLISTYYQKFDNNGKLLEWEIKDLDAELPYIGGDISAESVATDSFGNSYVVHNVEDLGDEYIDSHIHKFDKNGKLEWKSEGPNQSEVCNCEMATDSLGNVYVLDTYNSRIQKINSTTGYFLDEWVVRDENSERLNVNYIDTDSLGNVYVSSFTNNHLKIFEFNNTGEVIDEWDVTDANEIFQGRILEIDSSDNVFLIHQIERENVINRILKFNSEHEPIDELYINTTSTYVKIAADSLGNVFIFDHGQNKILKVNNDGMIIKEWGSKGVGNYQFNEIYDIAVDSSDNVYVVDYSNYRIHKFTNDGKFLAVWSGIMNYDASTWLHRIGLDSAENVYVLGSSRSGFSDLTDHVRIYKKIS